MKRALTTLLLIICTLLFLFACSQLVQTYREYEDGTSAYEELDDVYTTILPPSTEPQMQENDEPQIVQETAPITVDREYEDGTSAYEELDDVYTTILPPSTEPQMQENDEPQIVQETAPITVDFESLTAQYPDVVAWIYCPDTIIDYPIMQAKNNEKYLRTLPNGTWN